jgi:hypothetical protein
MNAFSRGAHLAASKRTEALRNTTSELPSNILDQVSARFLISASRLTLSGNCAASYSSMP